MAPLPLPNNEETLLGQSKVCRPAQTTTLLWGEGERDEIKADHLNSPKSFVPHCRGNSSNVSLK